MLNKMNKRGDVASIIYVVMFLAIVGILIFLIVHLNITLFQEIESTLNDTEYNDTEAMTQAITFEEKNASSIWDYAFLGIFFGVLIAIALSAYAVRISPIFYWVYGAISLMVLVMGVVLSNLWQGMAAEAEFATTITHFPIMNAMLGTYYPLVVTAIIIVSMVILFGKPSEQAMGGEI